MSILYVCMLVYVCACMRIHLITIDENKSLEFEGKWEVKYERKWKIEVLIKL